MGNKGRREYLRAIYERYWKVKRKAKKVRVGSKVRRVYDAAGTPFERVRACAQADTEQVARLEDLRKGLDPFRDGS